MWIVRLALRNPYSVAVLAIVLLIMGILSATTMLIDIFPIIDIPVIGVVWSYPGLSAEEMESRVVIISERAFSTTVQGISRIESQSISGIGNIRVYFQPGTEIGSAVSQISSVSQTILRILPPGITPPNVLPFNAANVPITQLTIFSDILPEQQLFDYALNFIRIRLFTIPGLATPAPYGGAGRQINVDVLPNQLASVGLSPVDISTTLQNSNIIQPAGLARIGKLEYDVLTNSNPKQIEEFGRFPVKIVNGREVKISDVAKVQDGHAFQTNAVRINGKRAIYLNIIKKSDASTLSVVNRLKSLLPSIQREAPQGMQLRLDFDQSTFVRAAVLSVLEEAIIAAVLVSAMILVFLRSFQSVLIVCTSIPLSILASLIALKLTSQSINIMTLGGLALSIGMLVDDATVEIENINRNRPLSPNITVAILRGARQIALPAIVTTLAICIVFFPIELLTGPAKFLFTPLALSVVFAMIASYLLSRTLVPVLAQVLLRNTPLENHRETFFDRLREAYGRVLAVLIHHPKLTLVGFLILFAISLFLPLLVIGTDFFPATDAGILKLHFRAPSGSRLEETERIIAAAEQRIRAIIPADELETINVMIGIPTSYNLAFVPTDNAASMDAEILISLKKGNHNSSSQYQKRIREDFAKNFPGSTLYFQSADIVSQVLNFGLAAPLDLQVESRDLSTSYEIAKKLRDKISLIPGAEDVVIRQVLDYPSLRVNVDRARAAQLGLTERDVTTSLLLSLTSSSLVSPSYYINPENNVNYPVAVQVPIVEIASVPDLLGVPVTPANQNTIIQKASLSTIGEPPLPPTQTVGSVATLDPTVSMSQVNHVDVQRVIDILANIEGRDLGSVTKEVQKAIQSLGKLPTGVRIHLRGQSEVMEESFTKLGLGMILAALLVYLLMVTLFQSWLDPLIIMMAVPGAISGVLWLLALTGSTINVESLMGTIMSIGIAVSNSNLLVNFANEIRIQDIRLSSGEAALEAGKVRIRPVLMTALAMLLGMIPMALALSEAGSQNAPLGRAVIGGLLFSTVATLFVVPVFYTLLRRSEPTKHKIRQLYEKEEAIYDAEQHPKH